VGETVRGQDLIKGHWLERHSQHEFACRPDPCNCRHDLREGFATGANVIAHVNSDDAGFHGGFPGIKL
jgi:hypothetical protein